MTAGIECRGLAFTVGEFSLQGVELSVAGGEYFVLTGPNGSGKSVLLKLMTGIYRPAAGRITIGAEEVTDRAPWERGIGYVPQDGALFPHLSVRDNIAFGPRMRGIPRDECYAKARAMAERLQITSLLDRRAQGLSGGETQKVALARALVIGPRLLLLDEPVSAIDEEARDAVCRDLKRIQQDLGITTIHVSHNRRETELVADRVGLLRDGVLGETATSGAQS